MEATPRSQPPHNIALLPPPTFLGHLIPFIELAKKLVFHHNCTITLIIPDDGSSMKPQKSLLQGLPTTINTVFLPPVPTGDLPENASAELLLSVRLTRSFPALRDTLTSLKELGTSAAALVVDLFA
ncbi:UNVERIFIED_CONTAM: UDP-glycosyltransferase 72B3 [Sesamum latifolium]|uniref:UDP-glycosyltransferase 72B3 n=1 Tax=Sesamum latifolium TaxID=2727402 RepID=A0AAW2XQJ5_9LAMI